MTQCKTQNALCIDTLYLGFHKDLDYDGFIQEKELVKVEVVFDDDKKIK